MKFVFCYQDMWNLVKNIVTPISDCATDDQKNVYKELEEGL